EPAACPEAALAVAPPAGPADRLPYAGTYFRCNGIEVLPKPLQKPHPPVWLAASSPEAIRPAGAAGFTIMMDPHSTHGEIAGEREVYPAAPAAARPPMGGREGPMARLLAIAPTRSAAEETARRGARWLVESYAGPQHQSLTGVIGFGVAGGPVTAPVDPVERYLDGVVLWGTPDAIVDEIARLRE